MIKRFFTENFSLKALSLFLAFVIWVLVVNVSKPEINDSRTVTLEVLNQDAFDSDFKTWVADRTSVTVSYNVRTDMRSSISSSDFRAYISLSDYSITGSVPVYYEVLNGKESIIDNVQIRPSVVKITLENIQKKKFDIKYTTTGDPKSGYRVVNIASSPESVYITGKESEIGRISAVGIELDVTGISANQDGIAQLVYYDANGNKLTNLQGVTSNEENIDYSVTVHKEKNINLLSSVTGTPAAGYQYESTTVSPDSVALSSLPGVIDSMTVFQLPEININEARDSVSVSFDLSQILPAGVELAKDQDPQINVLVRIEKLPDVNDNHGNPAPAPAPNPSNPDNPAPPVPESEEPTHQTEESSAHNESESVDTSDSSSELEESHSENERVVHNGETKPEESSPSDETELSPEETAREGSHN
ncbi:CdaR family protein [Oribacterium sp. FC2011]|uniref:CdaR family protein n=1 Tax=Oribacterium sp. FC2011 TaxID=1408311 RepID=UPI000679ABCC|nr:CdaR family protein [Oribacterium sp. FC2011]